MSINKDTFFEISGRKIGYNYDPLVIAEIGINHCGRLDIAFELVDAAHSVGVEVVKHQTHIVSDEMTAEAKNVIPGHTTESIYEIIDAFSLNEEDEIKLKNYIESKGMIFISTPFSRAAADRLNKMDVPAYKIGSGECNNYPLIEHICKFGKPIILSTGMNSIDSVKPSVDIMREYNIPYALLHCTNIYPTPPNLVRLDSMIELNKHFEDAVVGLSDHTTSNYACLGATALGASILERHFTDSMDREGPDIINSMDTITCKELIEGSKIMKQERGGSKGPVEEEIPTINFAYASIVTIREIKVGEKLTMENIWVKRPGTGPLFAKDFKSVLGKTANKLLKKDLHLKKDDFS